MTKTKIAFAACATFIASSVFAVEVQECTSLRIKGSCKPAEIVDSERQKKNLGGEKTIITRVRVPQPVAAPDNRCQAQVSISYVQMYDTFRVDATVANQQCAASSGAYKITARTISATGDPHTQEFTEQWRRGADTTDDLEQRHTYSMAGDERLVWARVSTTPKTLCICDDVPES
jgi:hypothetical protein